MDDWDDFAGGEDDYDCDDFDEGEGFGMKIEIEAEDALAEKVAGLIERRIYSRRGDEMVKQVEDAVLSKVNEIVAEHAEALAVEAIRPRIEKVLEEGWTLTDNYGGAKGHESVEAMIRKLLRDKKDSYSQQPWMLKLAENAVNVALKEHFTDELKAARAKFRENLDSILGAQVTKAMRDAVGIK